MDKRSPSIALALVLCACSRKPAVEVTTPEFAGHLAPLTLHSRQEYDAESRQYEGAPRLTRTPADLSPLARFGMILCRDGTAIIAVDGRAPAYSVIVDLNGNGDLTDDPRKVLEPGTSDASGHALHAAIFESPEGRRFRVATPDRGREAGKLFHDPTTARRGTLRVGSQTIAFAVEGYCGRFDQPTSAVAFDLDGNGTADLAPSSDERFALRERTVVLDGKSYDFEVEPTGTWVHLTPSKEDHPPRPSLADGAQAPDFTFVDLAGQTTQLSSYRGRVVLLHFWATWSQPCWHEMPEMLALYSRFHEQGLEVLGLAAEEAAYSVQSYVARNKIRWPQMIQGRDGPVFQTYRVPALPLGVLVDREGRIAAKGTLDDGLAARISELMDMDKEPRP
jgi:peroxiredoxin